MIIFRAVSFYTENPKVKCTNTMHVPIQQQWPRESNESTAVRKIPKEVVD
jgi:hypothetical protein